jgi:hypothetical protein
MNKNILNSFVANEDVVLVAVTKSVNSDVINQLLEAGVTDIGENRIQSAREKFLELKYDCTKHLIGHLQTNKVKDAVNLFDYIHSVDSLRLASLLDKECAEQSKKIKVFFQINIGDDENKYGFTLEEFEDSFEELMKLKHIESIGLMTFLPYSDNPEDSREYFKQMKELSVKYGLPELSMGMSGDYEMAIEEGATFVRVGRKLFEG